LSAHGALHCHLQAPEVEEMNPRVQGACVRAATWMAMTRSTPRSASFCWRRWRLRWARSSSQVRAMRFQPDWILIVPCARHPIGIGDPLCLLFENSATWWIVVAGLLAFSGHRGRTLGARPRPARAPCLLCARGSGQERFSKLTGNAGANRGLNDVDASFLGVVLDAV